jgi:phage baseplate assembly protein W
MAAIVVNSVTSSVSGSLYKDLLLDVKIDYTRNTQLLKRREVKDIQISEDISAIKNSLFNLFTTMPGQKILNPVYGLNLTQYLFVQATRQQGRIIGETILKGVSKYEPRITMRKLNVEVDEDNNQYNIFMLIDVPTLNITGVSLKGVLSDSGYYFN